MLVRGLIFQYTQKCYGEKILNLTSIIEDRRQMQRDLQIFIEEMQRDIKILMDMGRKKDNEFWLYYPVDEREDFEFN